MDLFEISGILITACAFCSFVNYKWIKLPSSMGLVLLAMLIGLLANLLEEMGFISGSYAQGFLSNINFHQTVFHGMLPLLLFAGGLQITFEELKSVKIPIGITATISTFLSALIIGTAFYYLANHFGFTNITILYALLFGAILSPTDPISALSIIRRMHIAKKIETTIVGEALFNDGIAIVFFLSILELINVSEKMTIVSVTRLLFQEVAGGILFGIAIGWVAYQMLRKVDAYQVALFITLAVATGGYLLAEKIHVSAPLAMVIAGIIIGKQMPHIMTINTRKYVDSFWENVNDILNTILFFLIGLGMMTIKATGTIVILGLACIVIALIARYISVAIPLTVLKPFYDAKRGTLIILTWGGLRGALSIAMVLSLQIKSIEEIFLPCIYFVVIFSIAVQGLTLSRIIKRYQLAHSK